MLPTLRRIGSRAHTTTRKLASRVPPSSATSATLPLRDLILPEPDSVHSRLIELGLDESTTHQVAAAWARFSQRLKTRCLVDFAERRQLLRTRASYYEDDKAFSLLLSAYVTIYQQTLHRWSSYILEDFAPRFLRAQAAFKQKACDSAPSSRRRPFNQAAIPLLEAFFDNNAFPSRLDKHELAAKCDMDYRQIHVWFQNRRSRHRKEGKELKKRDASVPLMDELENRLVEAALPLECTEDSSEPYIVSPACTVNLVKS
ncbi:hypothetical protein C8Q73DRAFT_788424 [Cubamyces lactineus]|nr:hypothetical protein C8Q73DRAFT_788424 [Cubamyces lactineus]